MAYYGYVETMEEPTPVEKERWFEFLYAYCLQRRENDHDTLRWLGEREPEGVLSTGDILESRIRFTTRIYLLSDIIALMDKFSMEEK